jgi:hypothetical protein
VLKNFTAKAMLKPVEEMIFDEILQGFQSPGGNQ